MPISYGSRFRNYPQFLRIKPGQFLADLVRICSHQFQFFASSRSGAYFLWWGHREQDVPNNKKNKKQHKECAVRQELYLSSKYEKAQQDVGLFYAWIIIVWCASPTILTIFQRANIIDYVIRDNLKLSIFRYIKTFICVITDAIDCYSFEPDTC